MYIEYLESKKIYFWKLEQLNTSEKLELRKLKSYKVVESWDFDIFGSVISGIAGKS